MLLIASVLATTPARADLPDGVILDDGYTWFSVKSVDEPVDGKATDRGWSLQYTVRFVGDIPAFSAARTIVSKDGKTLADVRRSEAQGHSDSNLNAGKWLALRKSQVADDLIIGDGVYDVALYYVDGATDKEYLAREYKLDIRKVHRQHQLRFINPPHYYVNHHGNIKDAIISQRQGDEGSYLGSYDGFKGGQGGGPGVTGANNTGMFSQRNWVSALVYLVRDDDLSLSNVETSSGSRIAGTVGYLTAEVDGEAIKLTHPELRFQDAVYVTLRNSEIVIHTDRYAEQYHRGTENREPLGFARYLLNFSLTWGPTEQRVESYVALDDHPGDWVLNWVANGETIRTWQFTVGDNGLIQPHDDESDAELTFPARTHLVEMAIPSDGSSVDSRLTADFVDDFAFYGLGLPRSLTDDVPRKNNPFPQFSGPRVEPEEAGAADRARRQAVKDRVSADQAADSAERDSAEAQRQAQLQAGREASAADDDKRQADHEARQAEIADLVESEKAKAMAEVERMKEGYSDAMDDAQNEARYSSGLPFWIRLLLGFALVGGGVVLAGPFLSEKVAPAKSIVDGLRPFGTILGWGLLGLGIVSLLVDLLYLRPLVANGLPQLLALAAGIVLSRGALKERLTSVQGGAAEQAAKTAEMLEKQEARFALLDNNASYIGLAAIVAGLLHLIAGSSAII